MSGNYNTWGGKNNRWGNRNRKGGSNTPSRNTHYEPSKAFNVFAGGVCLFLLGALGLNIITGAISGIKDGIDTVKDTVSIVKDTTGTSNTSTGNNTVGSKIEAKIIDNLDFEIDAEDVSNILEYVSDELSDPVDNMILLSYSDISTLDNYTHNIVEKLPDYGKTAVFGVVCDNTLNSKTVEEQKEAIKNMATDNEELLSSYGVTQVITGGLSGLKSVNNPVVTITYIK